MATFAEAVAAFGIAERDGEDTIVVRFNGKRWTHYRLADLRDEPIPPTFHWYVAAGGFIPGSVEETHGRSGDNLASVRFVGFDFDLKDWLNVPGEQVYAMSDGEVASLCEGLRRHVEDVLTETGIPIHGLEYSGHGLFAWIRLAPNSRDDLPTIKAAYKALIERINTTAGVDLADRQVSDAGTRIARLPLSRNVKQGASRETRVIWDRPGEVTVEELAALSGVAEVPRQSHLRAVPTPTNGSLDDGAVARLVALVRPYWVEGDRHYLALAIGGACAKVGLKEEQAATIVETLADGDEVEDRLKAVRRSYKRHETGEPTKGWYGLKDRIPASELVAIDAVLETVRNQNTVKLRLGGSKGTSAKRSPDNPATFRVTPFPEEAFHGWFAAYRNLYAPTTEAADQFHLAAALTLAASTIGRRVRLDVGDGLYGNLYALILGPSGSSRKDTAIKSAYSMPAVWAAAQRNPTAPWFGSTREIASAEGLVKTLQDAPTTWLYLSEINSLLLNARRKGTSTILDKLIEAWDAPVVLENNSKLSPGRALHPTLSIISAGQPGRFAEMIADEDIFSGFANRWLYVPGIGGDPLPVQGQVPPAETAALYHRLVEAVRGYGEEARLPFDSDALALNADWYATIRKSLGKDEAEDSMRQRHQTIAHKIALIYAVADGARYVEAQHLSAAVALVEWSWENVRRYMATWGVGPIQKLERRILDVLEERGPVTRRQLQQACGSRKWTSFEFGRAVDSLIRNDMLAVAGGLIGLPADE